MPRVSGWLRFLILFTFWYFNIRCKILFYNNPKLNEPRREIEHLHLFHQKWLSIIFSIWIAHRLIYTSYPENRHHWRALPNNLCTMGITVGKKSKKVQYLALTCQIWKHCAWIRISGRSGRFGSFLSCLHQL